MGPAGQHVEGGGGNLPVTFYSASSSTEGKPWDSMKPPDSHLSQGNLNLNQVDPVWEYTGFIWKLRNEGSSLDLSSALGAGRLFFKNLLYMFS